MLLQNKCIFFLGYIKTISMYWLDRDDLLVTVWRIFVDTPSTQTFNSPYSHLTWKLEQYSYTGRTDIF